MKLSVWVLLVGLVLLHDDYWYKNDPTLLFGWCPIGLFYHIMLSLAACAFWLFVVKRHWPSDLAAEDTRATTSDNGDASS